MSLSALAAAKRVCKRSGWNISNLKLQKILYMAQLMYAGEHDGQKLMEAQFQAWDYGPVEPSIYGHVSRFGRAPITDIFGNIDDGEGTPEAKALDSYADDLLNYTGGQLVNMTHWEGGAWAKHYIPATRDIIIPHEDIIEEYHARVGS